MDQHALLKELQAKLQAILAASEAEGRDLSDDEATQCDGLVSQITEAKDKIAEAERKAQAKEAYRQTATQAAEFLNASPGRQTKPAHMPMVQSVREMFYEDPQRGFHSLGDFARTVATSAPKEAIVDGRLTKIKSEALGNSTSGNDGEGYVIPPEYSTKMIERVMGENPVLQRCDRYTLSGNTLRVNGLVDNDRSVANTAYGGVIVSWPEEGAAIETGKLKFRQVELRLKKIAALAVATEEMLSDANISLGDWLFNKMSAGIGDELATALFDGNGIGKPTGILGHAAMVTVAKESEQTAKLVLENLTAMRAALEGQGMYGNAVWYANPEVLAPLYALSKDYNMIMMPPGGGPDGLRETLMGRPIEFTDKCEALGTVGDIILADFSKYILVTKGTINTAMSIHLLFDTDQTAFKATFRVDGKPGWDQALKPRKGTAGKLVSPFVSLAAR